MDIFIRSDNDSNTGLGKRSFSDNENNNTKLIFD